METCDAHSGLAYAMVCSSCSDLKFVCPQCIENEHKEHTVETFESVAQSVLEQLRKEKANNLPHFKEVKLDLKTCSTLREKERIKSGETRRSIERRRDHLKQAVDEIADDLLGRHEASTNDISKVFDKFEKQVEEKVKNILKFQNDLAHLENSSDYKRVIEIGKGLTAPSLSCLKVPSINRMTLTQGIIDRNCIKQMFGEEVHEDIRKSFVTESLEHQENQQHGNGVKIDANNSKYHPGGNRHNLSEERDDNTEQSADPTDLDDHLSCDECVPHSQSQNLLTETAESKATGVTHNVDTEISPPLTSNPAVVNTKQTPSLKISDPSNLRKRYATSKRGFKDYSVGEAKMISDCWSPGEGSLPVGFHPIRDRPVQSHMDSCLRPIEDDGFHAPELLSSMTQEFTPTARKSGGLKVMSHDKNGGIEFTSQRTIPVRRKSSKVATQDEAGVILSTFQHATCTPTAICPSDSNHCWIVHNNTNEIKHINNSGVVKRTVVISGSKHLLGMVTLADGSLLICSPHTKSVKQVHHPSCHVFEVFHTAPLIPVGICVSVTGDILMTLIDKWSYDKSRNSHRVLMKSNSKWKMTAEAKYSKHGGNLFVLPYKVAVSNTGKLVAVINQTSDMTSHLMLFDIHFTLLLRCIGHENVILGDRPDVTMTERFNVMDVKFDVTDNLVIVEGYTGTVQVLDPVTGGPLRILVKEQGSPWTLAVYDKNMWVGFQDGRIKCLTY